MTPKNQASAAAVGAIATVPGGSPSGSAPVGFADGKNDDNANPDPSIWY